MNTPAAPAKGSRLWSPGSARFLCLLAVLLALAAPPAAGQTAPSSLRIELGVDPDEVTVGDPFRSVARISAPEGYSVRYLELAEGDSIAALRPLEIAGGGDGRETAIFTLVAWAAGPDLRAPARIEVTAPDGSVRSHEIRLQLPVVRSVLPEDTAGLAPRPAKGILAPPATSPFPWWLLALLLLLALVLWLAHRAWKNRGSAAAPIDPRQWALQQLSDEHLQAVAPADDPVWLFDHVSGTIRSYIALTYPGLTRDLTTSELLQRLGREDVHSGSGTPTAGRYPSAGSERSDPTGTTSVASPDRRGSLPGTTSTTHPATASPVAGLSLILEPADRVKFARYRPLQSEAGELLHRARTWITENPRPDVPDSRMRAA